MDQYNAQCRKCGGACKQSSRVEIMRCIMFKTRSKDAVRRRTQKAIKDRTLIRPDTCHTCGAVCKPEAHHINYDNAHSVEWLCANCHRKAHGYFPLKA